MITNNMKAFDEIIEIEFLDRLITEMDSELMTAILLALADELNSTVHFQGKYEFDMIPYGFQGYYPVIAVGYLVNTSGSVESEVLSTFNKMIEERSLREFIEGCNKNKNKRIEKDIGDGPIRMFNN